MIILSQKCAGIVIQCPNCGIVLAIDPRADLYEEHYAYCPLCKEKIDTQIRESTWEYVGGKTHE